MAFLVVPLFALSNAGVRVEGNVAEMLPDPVTIGVFVGLVIGKQVGITLGALAAVRLGVAALPVGVTWGHIYGAAWLGGIGFTMSLFIRGLAFGEGAPELASAKIGILIASIIAGGVGLVLLGSVARRERRA